MDSDLHRPALGSVHLTRFTVHSHQLSELVRAGRIAALAASDSTSTIRLLVELDDGDWLDISITGPNNPPDEDFPYLELADGIVGDEDGAIIAATPNVIAGPH